MFYILLALACFYFALEAQGALLVFLLVVGFSSVMTLLISYMR